MTQNILSNLVINLDIDEINDEINNMMKSKMEYNEYLKDNYINKKKNLYKNIISTKIGKLNDINTETITFEDFPIKFYTKNSENSSNINFEVYDEMNKLLFKKQIIIPKVVNFDIIDKYDKEIDNSNLTIKMKNLMDKINKLNTIKEDNKYIQLNGNRIDQGLLNDKLDKYKNEYNELKVYYNNLFENRRHIVNIKKDMLHEENSIINILNQEYNYFKSENIILYQESLNNLNNLNIQEYINNKKNEIIYEKIRNINKDIYNNRVFEHNTLIIKQNKNIITPKIIIINNLRGNYIKNQNQGKNIINNVSLTQKIKDISIENINEELNIYNKNTRFIIYDNANSVKVGTALHEKIPNSDIDEYNILNTFSDWRKKLADSYITRISFINIIPIVIDNNCFSSIEHYYYYIIFNNRIDIRGKLSSIYQNFANSLLINKNGENATHHNKTLINIINKSKLIIRIPDNLNIELQKAYYAKFNQQEELKHILLHTKDALLINKMDDKYVANNNLMFVRKLIRENTKPIQFYENYSNDQELFSKKYKKIINKGVQESKINKPNIEITDNDWKNIYLPLLDIMIVKYNYDEVTHKFPDFNKIETLEWIKTQKQYFINYQDELTKELIMLLTMKSMKLFNYIIDENSNRGEMKLSINQLMNKLGEEQIYNYFLKISEYALHSPKNNNEMTIFSGINRKYYEKIKDLDNFTTNRLISASFNKEHANYYSFIGDRGNYSRENQKPYIVYNITIPKNFNKMFYYEYENQIVFMPGITFLKYKPNEINQENVIEINEKRINIQDISIENVFYKLQSNTDSKIGKKQSKLSIKNINNTQIDILKQNGLYKKGMKQNEIDEALGIIISKDGDSISLEIEKLESVIQSDNLYIIDMPPDGDCLYYSLTHGLYNNNIQPFDFDNNISNELNKVTFLPVEYGVGVESCQPILKKATIYLRKLIADKLELNLKNPTEDLEALKISDLYNLNTEDDIKTYINSVRYMVTNKNGPRGGWGDNNIITLVSALLNVNFKIYYSQGNILDINSKYSKTLFPLGKSYNLDIEPITIYLGSYTNKHYVLLSKEYIQKQLWELKIYYIIKIILDSDIFKMVVYKEDNETEYKTIGIYDSKLQIWDKGDDVNLFNILNNKVKEFLNKGEELNNNPSVKIKKMWVNSTDGSVVNPSKGINPIGILKNENSDFILSFN